MSDPTSLVNLGGLAKPATVLIKKISDAIGACFEPWQIRRVARARADAEKIEAVTQIEITNLQRRAMERLFVEEAKKQDNIESITAGALPMLDQDADPSQVEDDWIVNFFDKCRLVSDEEMQALWSTVLAGEANGPGKYSKRTVNLLGSLDKKDAKRFASLCRFSVLDGLPMPLVYDVSHELYQLAGITFVDLKHLDDIGLISFESLAGYKLSNQPKTIGLSIGGKPLVVTFAADETNSLDVGHALFTQTGKELAGLCNEEPIEGFLDYLIGEWVHKGYVLSSPLHS